MKISGASFVRNGVKLGYPFLESVRSILPICDEAVIAVGDSDDGTKKMIEGLNSPKITIIDTVWDDSNRAGGKILSGQTNIALSKCKSDWILYIQADEALHEEDYGKILAALDKYDGDRRIDGIAFDYIHFYGSYSTVQKGRHWYSEEVRLIRNNSGIVSFGDAQGFRKAGKKIRAVKCGARVYHYGWARPPEKMMEKIKSFHKYWHDDRWIEQNCSSADVGSYFNDLGNLAAFEGTHPAVMRNTVNSDNDIFINGCRADYVKNRPFPIAVRDWARSLPVGRHRNFRLVRG